MALGGLESSGRAQGAPEQQLQPAESQEVLPADIKVRGHVECLGWVEIVELGAAECRELLRNCRQSIRPVSKAASAAWDVRSVSRVRILVIVSRVHLLQKCILIHLKERWERLTPSTLTRL